MRYGDDCIIGEPVDEEAETHEGDDNPAVFFLTERDRRQLLYHLLSFNILIRLLEVAAH